MNERNEQESGSRTKHTKNYTKFKQPTHSKNQVNKLNFKNKQTDSNHVLLPR